MKHDVLQNPCLRQIGVVFGLPKSPQDRASGGPRKAGITGGKRFVLENYKIISKNEMIIVQSAMQGMKGMKGFRFSA